MVKWSMDRIFAIAFALHYQPWVVPKRWVLDYQHTNGLYEKKKNVAEYIEHLPCRPKDWVHVVELG
jgi:hypothetical protein